MTSFDRYVRALAKGRMARHLKAWQARKIPALKVAGFSIVEDFLAQG